jgi:hypothetical protein
VLVADHLQRDPRLEKRRMPLARHRPGSAPSCPALEARINLSEIPPVSQKIIKLMKSANKSIAMTMIRVSRYPFCSRSTAWF